MKIKKSLCMMLVVFQLVPGGGFAADTSREVQEAVIQQIVDELHEDPWESLYGHRSGRVILKAKWDRRSSKLDFEKSSVGQMEDALGMSTMPIYEQDQVINARNLALASISAGGIIYFIPESNTIFWEKNEEEQDLKEQLRQERLWTNPILGNLLSSFLTHAQKEIAHKQSIAERPSRWRSFLMVVLNPAASFVKQANKMANQRYFSEGSTDIVTVTPGLDKNRQNWDDREMTNYIGLQFTIRF